MSKSKVVKDLMIDVFDYPHVPYWFTIGQAIKIIKVSFVSSKKYPEPLAILVFDEKYNLMGTIALKDILSGLEPRFMKPAAKVQAYTISEPELALIWDALFHPEPKQLA